MRAMGSGQASGKDEMSQVNSDNQARTRTSLQRCLTDLSGLRLQAEFCIRAKGQHTQDSSSFRTRPH